MLSKAASSTIFWVFGITRPGIGPRSRGPLANTLPTWLMARLRVLAKSPGDRGLISGRVIPKTQKMVLHASLLNTQHYKVRIKGKVEQSREWSSTLYLHLSVVAIEKGAFGSPSTKVANFTYFTFISFNSSILSIKFAQAINMFLLIRPQLFYIAWHAEILNHHTFPLLQVSELCSSFSNNCGGDFW